MVAHRLVLFAVAAALIATGLVGCDRGSGEQADALPTSPDARAERFATLQTSLVSQESRADGRTLVRSLERPRVAEEGRVRGEVDLSRATIDYFRVNPTEAVAALGVIDVGDAPLRIIDYGPVGLLPLENARPRIYVMFSQPMVPLSALGEVITDSPLLSLDPAVPGVYRWYGTRALSFEPEAPLTQHPAYQVRVSEAATSLGGNALPAGFSFAIYTERLEIVNAYAGTPREPYPEWYDIPTAAARAVVLEFNQEIDTDLVSTGLRVEINRQPAGFTVGRPDYPPELASRADRAVQITLEEDPPEQSLLRITVPEGTRPRAGFPQTERDQTQQLRTIAAFTVHRLTAFGGAFPRDNRPYSYPVFLDFSHPLTEGAADEPFTVLLDDEPVVPSGIDRHFSNLRFFVPNARPGQVVTVIAPATVSDIYGRELGGESTHTYTIPRPEPVIEFPGHRAGLRHLEAAFDPAIVFNMRNVVGFSLGRSSGDEFFANHQAPVPVPFDISDHTPDFTHFHEYDLAPLLSDGGYGTVFFAWQAEKDPELVTNPRFRTETGEVAVQVTDLGITTRFAYNRILVWVNRLSSGLPVADAHVEAFNLTGSSWTGSSVTGRTDADGLAVIDLEDEDFASRFTMGFRTPEANLHLRVRKDGDTAEMRVDPTHNAWRFGAQAVQSPTEALIRRHRVHLFTDRGIYQPGEEFAFRGIHWLQDAKGFTPAEAATSIEIASARTGTVVWRRQQRPSASGGFAGRITLPEDLDHGTYELTYHYGPGRWDVERVPFTVGSFRRVALEVTSRLEHDEVIAGESAAVSMSARYLAGGAVAGAAYEYVWTRSPVRFVPPGTQWQNWTFGTSEWGSQTIVARGSDRLSAVGTATTSAATTGTAIPDKPYRYTLEARVEDIDRQIVAHSRSLVVHPADHYVAARFVQDTADGWWSRFVPTGSEVVAEARLVSADGEALSRDGTVRYGLVKGEWRAAHQQGLYGRLTQRWEYVEETLYEEEAGIRGGLLRHSFSVADPGSYTLFFVSLDPAGRETRTEIRFYATGSGWVRTASQTPSDIQMLVDKPVYEPGETARILVQSPLPEGRYLLTVEREGLIDQRIVELSGSNEVIEVPVEADYVPVFYVALTSYTSRTETQDDYFQPDLGRPRGLFGLTSVSVSTRTVELDVEITSEQRSYGPGDEGDMTVRVTRNGLPVADAEVTLLGVDRGVLDLIGYRVPDPIEYFYHEHHFPLGVTGDDSRRLLLRPVTYDIATLQGGDGDKLDERSDFTPLALFEPEARTDADGYARVTFDYPDNLTTYRFTAIAVHGSRLGMSEYEVMVQNPINVRTAMPRRLRGRDTAVAGVVLTNTTGVEQHVRVTAASDILLIADESTKEITIPPHSAYELPWVLEAHEAGEGVITFTTRSSLVNEVLRSPVVVERPLITEAFSTTGIVADTDDGTRGRSAEGLLIPSAIGSAYGSLAVTLDTTAAAFVAPHIERLEVSGAPASDFRRLYDLSLRALGHLPLEDRATLLKRLAEHQFPDGGIGLRPPATEFARADLFLTLLTAQVLQQARDAGRSIDGPIDRQAILKYLGSYLAQARARGVPGFTPTWAASLLAAAGQLPRDDIAFLREAGDALGIAGNALLAETYLLLGEEATAREIYDRLRTFVVIGTQTVDVRETYEARGSFATGERELALMLRAGTLLGEAEELLLLLAATLRGTESARRFASTHDDFWVVHGFAPFLARERTPGGPDGELGVTVRLGERALVEQRLDAGATSLVAAYPLFAGPLADAPRDELLALSFERDGPGQLYYANVLRYALPGETAPPRDEGIEVRRRIERLDGTEIEGEILPLGETLRMRVFLSSTRRLSYLNLQVPLPSGAEILDPSLRTTGSYVEAGGLSSETWTRETVWGDETTFTADGYASYGRGGWAFWFYRPIQRIYDNAMLYTWEDFYPGERDVSFLFRTTTPGVFPTPPVQASLEFEPEVFGRSDGRLYVIRE